EDGIRDFHVTGVQTCALPIFAIRIRIGGIVVTGRMGDRIPVLHRERIHKVLTGIDLSVPKKRGWKVSLFPAVGIDNRRSPDDLRSEERRVGKECRYWWAPENS